MPTIMNTPKDAAMEPVRKSIRVRANAARAFRVFTEELDSWWPRTHHIGKSPMTRGVMEGRKGGRCYSEQADGTECDWGRITEWEPPRRFVMAWLIQLKGEEWLPEPDASACSEVEVIFTPQADGSTVVDLEHRAFERMIAGGAMMRASVNQEGGWNGLMQLYKTQAESYGAESEG